MGATALSTPRLRLRAWTEDDTALLARLGAVPEVVRYVGDGRVWTAERSAEVAARVREHWLAHGFGWRVALPRAGGAAVGFIALNYAGEGTEGLAADEFEIGWWLDPQAWGQGLASEGARAVADEAFGRLGAPSLVARILPGNRASQRVAAGLGMALEFETVARPGVRCGVYRVNARQAG